MTIPELNQRRLVERLSGWRLMVFFISAVANLGFLGLLIWLPWVLTGSWPDTVIAFIAASHTVFLMFLAGFRFPISIKIAFGAAHAVACIWAIHNLEATSEFQLPLVGWCFLLIPGETIILTVGGILHARRTGFHQRHRFSVSDILILVTAFAILFPVLLKVWPPISFSFFKINDYLRGLLAALSGWWGLIIVNLLLSVQTKLRDNRGKPDIENAKLWQRLVGLAIGTFLLSAMLDWYACQFGLLVALWISISSLPMMGLSESWLPSRRNVPAEN